MKLSFNSDPPLDAGNLKNVDLFLLMSLHVRLQIVQPDKY